ncbi:MAG: hypothetical protein LKF61_04515 [Eggerthellaceae bacterium]|jgi:sporulation protein YlmC with PRC-barrel domain|nr:hypothetical protein [Eggerthellaceae bacterium]MCH4220567.1 hypothetical protein [Eggerthellaceae bacterium]
METNESILNRDVIVLDSRQRIGTIKDLHVDCDTKTVNEFVVDSASTHSVMVLPFEHTISIGDTFAVVQSRDDFLASNTPAAKLALVDGFTPLDMTVYARSGNRLGTVVGFEFDSITGTVEKIKLDTDATFERENLLFFTPEYIFVEDGQSTAQMIRAAAQESVTSQKRQGTAVSGNRSARMGAATIPSGAENSNEQFTDTSVKKSVRSQYNESKPDETESDNELEILRDSLKGSKLNEDVTSSNGNFSAKKGQVIDDKLFDQAKEENILDTLTMAVDF